MAEKKRCSEKDIIARCLQGERKAQTVLYGKYAPKMFGICMRYAKNTTDAEDILQEGFIKIFRYLKDYRGDGSFEGWMRRIMVTTALNFYKRKNLLNKEIDVERVRINVSDPDAVSEMSYDEIISLIRELPDGYRTVFNLNTIEGYSHKEIGEMLQISVNTSKSQLSRAKSSLKIKIARLFRNDYPESDFVPAF